jgi:hypothetical protein
MENQPSESDVAGAPARKEADDDHVDEENAHFRDLLHLFGPSYAREAQFWKACLFSCVPQGIILAFTALGFFNFYTWMAEQTWLNHEYEEALEITPPHGIFEFAMSSNGNNFEGEDHESGEYDPKQIDLFRLRNGPWWYVGLLAGSGLAVGLVKVTWNLIVPPRYAFPQKVPSFLTDLRQLKAHNILLPFPMILCSALSIGLGAVCGPEAAMGAMGT